LKPTTPTLVGGQLGATHSEVIVHQHGSGVLTVVSPVSGGTGSLIKLGTGTLVLAPVVVQSGTLNGTTTVTVGSTANLSEGQPVTGPGIPAGTTVATIVNGTTVTLSAAATASASSQLTFGTGNVFSGTTTINAGTLQAGSIRALSPNSQLTLANVSGATLDLNGYNQTVKGLSGGGSTGGNVVLGSGATFTVGGQYSVANFPDLTNRSTYAGAISGTGNLSVTGGAYLNLTNGGNTYTGQTIINSGVLTIPNATALGTGSSTVVVGGIAAIGFTGGTLVLGGGTPRSPSAAI